MLFDVQSALAEILSCPLATSATQNSKHAPVSQMSRVSQRPPAENPPPADVLIFPPKPSAPAPSRPADDPFRHGQSVTGSPRTWTGRVVSLDEWRRLSDWDRHGSTGKIWNGLTRQWEQMKGDAHDR
jgi:hypothetical protein